MPLLASTRISLIPAGTLKGIADWLLSAATNRNMKCSAVR